jgi:hypothetical protein
MRMAALLGAAMLSSASLTSPCSFSDYAHWQAAQEYHEHAGAMHDRAEVEIQNCTCACGGCAVHAVELAKESQQWAIFEQAELEAISPQCRESL